MRVKCGCGEVQKLKSTAGELLASVFDGSVWVFFTFFGWHCCDGNGFELSNCISSNCCRIKNLN